MPRSRHMPREWDREHRFPLEVIARLGELGLMGVCVPEEYGGAGAGFLAYVLVLEELSRADAGVGVTVAVHTSAADAAGARVGDEGAVRAARPVACLRVDARGVRSHRAGRGLRRWRSARGGETGRGRLVAVGAEAVGDERRARGPHPRVRPHEPGGGGWRRHLGFPARSVTRDRDAGGGEARPQLVLHRRPAARERTRRRRSAAGRGGARVRDRARRARRRPDRHRRPGGRYRTGRLRHRSRVCRRAESLRPAARRSSGDRDEARQHGGRDRGGAPAHVSRGLAEGARPAPQGRGGEGEALRLGDGSPPDGRGDPGAGRLRVHEGVPRRALLPRREDHGDLRGNERDPADRDRALDPRAAA